MSPRAAVVKTMSFCWRWRAPTASDRLIGGAWNLNRGRILDYCTAASKKFMVIASALEIKMKKQLSRQPKRSHPVSAKIRTNRRPTKAGTRKRIGSTALAKKSNGVRQAGPTKTRLAKPSSNANRALAKLNANDALANEDQAARIDQVAPEKTSVARPETKKREDLIRHEEAMPINGASEVTNRSFNRTWLDWSNATMATNLRTTEELMRCKSPMELWAISSRFALKSWLNLLPSTRHAHLRM